MGNMPKPREGWWQRRWKAALHHPTYTTDSKRDDTSSTLAFVVTLYTMSESSANAQASPRHEQEGTKGQVELVRIMLSRCAGSCRNRIARLQPENKVLHYDNTANTPFVSILSDKKRELAK